LRDWVVCAENLHWLGVARRPVKLVSQTLASEKADVREVDAPCLSDDYIVEWRIALPEARETDSDYH